VGGHTKGLGVVPRSRLREEEGIVAYSSLLLFVWLNLLFESGSVILWKECVGEKGQLFGGVIYVAVLVKKRRGDSGGVGCVEIIV